MSDDGQLTSRTIGHAFDPTTPLPMSPRIGTAETVESGGLSLDEIEYAAPSGEYWVQNCLWLKEPRVKQFMRPKFWAIPLALIFTSVFLAIAAVLISVKHASNRNDTTAPITQDTNPNADACGQIAWPVGWILIRDPFNVKQLITIPPTGSSLLNYFDITEWDYIATFNGSAILFYGPQFPLLSNDTQIGALGTPDKTGHQFNSWGYLPTIWNVSRTKAWWGNLILPVDFSGASVPITPIIPPITPTVSSTGDSGSASSTAGSSGSTSGGASSSTGSSGASTPSSTGNNNPFNPFLSSTGRDFNPFSVHDPQKIAVDSGLKESLRPEPPRRFHLMAINNTSSNSSSTGGSSTSNTVDDGRYYLFNNRTNVHVNGYYVIPQTQPSTPVESSTGVNEGNSSDSSSSTGVDWSSSSSSTGVAGNATNATIPITPPPPVIIPTLPSVLPLYTLRLFPQYNGSLPLLMICGTSFSIPVATSSSSTGTQTTPVTYDSTASYISSSSSSSTGVRQSSSSTGVRSSTGSRSSSTGARSSTGGSGSASSTGAAASQTGTTGVPSSTGTSLF